MALDAKALKDVTLLLCRLHINVIQVTVSRDMNKFSSKEYDLNFRVIGRPFFKERAVFYDKRTQDCEETLQEIESQKQLVSPYGAGISVTDPVGLSKENLAELEAKRLDAIGGCKHGIGLDEWHVQNVLRPKNFVLPDDYYDEMNAIYNERIQMYQNAINELNKCNYVPKSTEDVLVAETKEKLNIS